MKLFTVNAATATLCIVATTAAASGAAITEDDCPVNYPILLDAEQKICTQEDCDIDVLANCDNKVKPGLIEWEGGIKVQPCEQCDGDSVLPDDSSVVVDSEDDIIREDDINNGEPNNDIDNDTGDEFNEPTSAPTFAPTFSPTFSPTHAPTSGAGGLFGSFNYITAGFALAFAWARS